MGRAVHCHAKCAVRFTSQLGIRMTVGDPSGRNREECGDRQKSHASSHERIAHRTLATTTFSRGMVCQSFFDSKFIKVRVHRYRHRIRPTAVNRFCASSTLTGTMFAGMTTNLGYASWARHPSLWRYSRPTGGLRRGCRAGCSRSLAMQECP